MPQEQKSSTFQTIQTFAILLSLLSLLWNTLIIKNIKRGGSKFALTFQICYHH